MLEVNEATKKRMIEKIEQRPRRLLAGKTIAVLGLSFKPNTDDIRESPALPIVQALLDGGATVRAYDPEAMPACRPLFPTVRLHPRRLRGGRRGGRARHRHRVEPVPQARPRPPARLLRQPLVIDLRNLYEPENMAAAGFRYVSIGRPEGIPEVQPQAVAAAARRGRAREPSGHHRRRRLPRLAPLRARARRGARGRLRRQPADRPAREHQAPSRTGTTSTFLEHDVSKPFEIEGPVDFILHFASPASPIDYLELPIQTLKVGSLGTHNALGLAKAKGARFLLASTSEVYGDPQEHPQKESYWGNVNPVGPRGVYDEAKRFAEAMTMAYHRYHGVDVRIVRIFNTYGPRMRLRDGRVVPAFIQQALTGEPMTVFGEGQQTRSFCYVDDLIEGIWRLLMSDLREPFNIGNPHEMTILEFAETIKAAVGSTSPIIFKPLPVDDPADAAAGHHPGPRAARLGAQGAAGRGAREHHRLLPRRSSTSRVVASMTRV